jgi:hypothetical protein
MCCAKYSQYRSTGTDMGRGVSSLWSHFKGQNGGYGNRVCFVIGRGWKWTKTSAWRIISMVRRCVTCEVPTEAEETTRHGSYNALCVLYEVGNESVETGDGPTATGNDSASIIQCSVCSLWVENESEETGDGPIARGKRLGFDHTMEFVFFMRQEMSQKKQMMVW